MAERARAERDAEPPLAPWALAETEAADLNGVTVRVVDAAVGRVTEGGKEEAEAVLILQVEAASTTAGPVAYPGWTAPASA